MSAALTTPAHRSIVMVYEGNVIGQSPAYDCSMDSVAVSTV